MASDELKSSYELAMERLEKKDRKSGVKARPLDEAQKSRIAALRSTAKAKLAEIEILHRKNQASAADPEKLAEIEQHYRIDRERIAARLESSIDRVRRGEPDEDD